MARRHSAEYVAYLRSPSWQTVRRQALVGSGGRCERCGARARVDVPWLEVNHKHYRVPFGLERWPRDIEALCPPCHREADARRRRRTAVRRWGGRLWLWVLLAVVLAVVWHTLGAAQ